MSISFSFVWHNNRLDWCLALGLVAWRKGEHLKPDSGFFCLAILILDGGRARVLALGGFLFGCEDSLIVGIFIHQYREYIHVGCFAGCLGPDVRQ